MQIYCDSADLVEIEEWNDHPDIHGFTTNPSLFKQAGITDAITFVKEVVRLTDKPVSIDGPPHLIVPLGDNIIPKILRSDWVRPGRTGSRPVNITAVCDRSQFPIPGLTSADIVSVFAGRIMDTGRNPYLVIGDAKKTGARVLWASIREPFNVHQAQAAGCDISTVTPSILRKYLAWDHKPLDIVAAETIQQFRDDAERLTW